MKKERGWTKAMLWHAFPGERRVPSSAILEQKWPTCRYLPLSILVMVRSGALFELVELELHAQRMNGECAETDEEKCFAKRCFFELLACSSSWH